LGMKNRVAKLEQQRTALRRVSTGPERMADLDRLCDLYTLAGEVVEGVRPDPAPEDLPPLDCGWETYDYLYRHWREAGGGHLSGEGQEFLDGMAEEIRAEARASSRSR
jgi:hypothetical protein